VLPFFGSLFGGGAQRQQQQQDQYAQQLEQTQNNILNAMFNRAQNVYWPLEDVAIPQIKSRAQSLPFYAPQAEQVAATLAEPGHLSY
jgi:hypothetical protein